MLQQLLESKGPVKCEFFVSLWFRRYHLSLQAVGQSWRKAAFLLSIFHMVSMQKNAITGPIRDFPCIYRIFFQNGKQTAKISASKDGINVIVGLLSDVLGVMNVSVVDRRGGISQHGGHQVDVLRF